MAAVVAFAAKAFSSSNGNSNGAANGAANPSTSLSSSSPSIPPSSSATACSYRPEIAKRDKADDDQEEGEEEQDEDSEDLDDETSSDDAPAVVDLGPIIPLKQQLELDKEDESLRRWKEQLLGSLNLDDGQVLEPQVKVLSLGIAAEGRPQITLQLPFVASNSSSSTSATQNPSSRFHLNNNQHFYQMHHAFTLKEGSCYRLSFNFVVSHNIVSGLTYINTVWKNGLRVDHTRTMLGTFGPRDEPYVHYTDEEITPCGLLARGSYSARTKFLDDDKRCYLELHYTFDIRKDWH